MGLFRDSINIYIYEEVNNIQLTRNKVININMSIYGIKQDYK